MAEKIFVIPLRKARRGTSRKFAPKAARYVAEFIKRHMKTEEVVIGPELNEFIWSRGITNPPRRVEVKAEKKDTAVHVNLSVIRPKPVEKKAEKKPEHKPEPREEKKAEPKAKPPEEHKAEPKATPKEEKKAEAKAEHKPGKKAEAKAKPKKAPAKKKKAD